jgi:Xaa-Pro aminopeptidase
MGADRRVARQDALVGRLEAHGLDGLLVAGRANVRYLTGFTGSAGLVLVTRAEVVLVTDFRYDTQAHAEAHGAARVAVDRVNIWDRLSRELVALGVSGTLGCEPHVLTVREAERLTQLGAGKAWSWAPAPDLVEQLRVRKDPDEVAAIRAAAELAGAALEVVLPRVATGQTELEIAGMLEYELRRLGSEDHPFPAIVASGERSALPHARAGSRVLRAGDWLLLDFGATVGGYCADLTRTVVVGAPATATQRALYAVVLAAQRRARAGIRAGMTGREADALARDVIAARGFGDAFGHSTGHGLGLEVHEAPRVAQTNDEPLAADAVVTIEPGVYLAGAGGVRLEDDVHLAADGAVLLSGGAGELVEVGTGD